MTGPLAIHALGIALESHLRSAWETEGHALTGVESCTISLLSSGQFAAMGDSEDLPQISLYPFRVTVNEHLRNVPRINRTSGMDVPLPLDVQYLLTVWTNNAREEQVLIAWAMRELYLHPILDASSLTEDAQWNAEDVIQIVPAELATEDMMRIWDALEPSYRLSVSYIGRVVRIDPNRSPTGRPVVATRLSYEDMAVRR